MKQKQKPQYCRILHQNALLKPTKTETELATIPKAEHSSMLNGESNTKTNISDQRLFRPK